jgi:hypothetical protein
MFKTSISLYTDIEDCPFDICIRYRRFFASISNFVFFDIGIFWSDPAWAAFSVQDTDCGVHIALQINHYPWLMCRPGRPQPPQRRLHLAARPHPLHRAQHRPQPPERGSAAGAAAAATGADINGSQERVILGDQN